MQRAAKEWNMITIYSKYTNKPLLIDSYAYIYNLYELNFRCENMFHISTLWYVTAVSFFYVENNRFFLANYYK